METEKETDDFGDVFLLVEIDWNEIYIRFFQILQLTNEEINESAESYKLELIKLYPKHADYINSTIRTV